MTDVSTESRAAELRGRLVDELVGDGTIMSKEVESALRAVPRHRFAPRASLEQAYARDSVRTKRNEHGVTVSSVSDPGIQAMMLEQSRLRPGSRCLEIGSGGYNAALMAEIVGDTGAVTTMDIDADIVATARTCLPPAGYDRVQVVLADGEAGCTDHAPYDRILVTVGAWDIPPAWIDQLTDDGVLVVPLRMRGLTRSVAFVRNGQRLVADSAKTCGFVTMQGAGAHHERLLLLRGEEIGLRFDDDGFPAEPQLLDGALEMPRVEAWAGVTVRRVEPFDALYLWLATVLDGFGLLSVDPALDSGLVAPQNRIACPAVVEGGTFAYLALRKLDDDRFEFGAHAFGPDADRVAAVMVEQIQRWDQDQRNGPGPDIGAYPAATPRDELPDGLVITKRHHHITISWPPAGQGVPTRVSTKE